MLELRNIHKSFGDVRVLDGVNLCLEKGFVYTLKGEESPIDLILCSKNNIEHIGCLMLGYNNMRVAQYYTQLASKKLMSEKLHRAVAIVKHYANAAKLPQNTESEKIIELKIRNNMQSKFENVINKMMKLKLGIIKKLNDTFNNIIKRGEYK